MTACEKYLASSLFVSVGCAESWYVRDFMIVVTRCFMSNLFLAKSFARASSSSSLRGGFESRKSSTGSTIPWPIRWNQTRLATDFAKKGFSAAVSQIGQRSAAVDAGLHVGVADADVARLHLLAGARLRDLAERSQEYHLGRHRSFRAVLAPMTGSGLVFTCAKHAARP